MDQKSAHFKKNHFAANLATRVALCFVAVFVIGAVLVLCVHVILTNHRVAAMEDTLAGLRRVDERNANISENEVSAKHELRAIQKRSAGNNASPNPPDVEKRLQALEQSLKTLVQGRDGRDGKPGSPGQQGIQGRDGRDGKDGVPGPRGSPGQQGEAGKPGTNKPSPGPAGPKGERGSVGGPGKDGSQGPKGEKGQEGSGKTGVKYVRWGRTTCPGGAQVVYKGIVGSDHYTHAGGGGEYICLSNNPKYDKYNDGWQSTAAIYGTEYEVSQFSPFKGNLHDHDAPCVVCYVMSRGSQLMMPARNDCPSGWTEEYHGYLMTEHYNHQMSRNFICIDKDAEYVPGSHANKNGALLYLVQGACGSLPCLPYVNGRELTCAVCTK